MAGDEPNLISHFTVLFFLSFFSFFIVLLLFSTFIGREIRMAGYEPNLISHFPASCEEKRRELSFVGQSSVARWYVRAPGCPFVSS